MIESTKTYKAVCDSCGDTVEFRGNWDLTLAARGAGLPGRPAALRLSLDHPLSGWAVSSEGRCRCRPCLASAVLRGLEPWASAGPPKEFVAKSYSAQSGRRYSSTVVRKVCRRIVKGDDHQTVIEDEIHPFIPDHVSEDDAWDEACEVYRHCEDLVEEGRTA